MEIFDGHRALPGPLTRPAVALGNFDGVHVGHQELLRRCVRAARAADGDAVVYTFDPHPAQVLAPAHAPPLICSRERKLELLADAGIDVCILEPFSREMADMAAGEFIEGPLTRAIAPAHIVVGYDFTFGKGRAGNADSLIAHGAERGFVAEVVAPVEIGGVVASSTEIRARVTCGDLDGAAALLGRHFDVDGTVVPGKGRGRTIGIPTANIATTTQLSPQPGVYAVWVSRPGTDQPALAGAANLGTNPTFETGKILSLEVHLLDFEGDLYGADLRVAFVEKLRDEMKFSGPKQLVEQIHLDIDRGRKLLLGST